jgi:hypothetical protein
MRNCSCPVLCQHVQSHIQPFAGISLCGVTGRLTHLFHCSRTLKSGTLPHPAVSNLRYPNQQALLLVLLLLLMLLLLLRCYPTRPGLLGMHVSSLGQGGRGWTNGGPQSQGGCHNDTSLLPPHDPSGCKGAPHTGRRLTSAIGTPHNLTPTLSSSVHCAHSPL